MQKKAGGLCAALFQEENTMENRIVTGSGAMRCHCVRLKRGEDLLESIRTVCRQQNIRGGVILSGVGCILKARIRDASGVNIHELEGHYEIVSLNGTAGADRCHIHIALSKENLETVGGHLCTGCVVNTTCELVIGELPGIDFGVEADPSTGYNEIIFRQG